ncbi:MAG: septum site-determining protein MinC [Firmicutes bacterium]|nr:septum site-determining protein MinC [Bacillota bacterium]
MKPQEIIFKGTRKGLRLVLNARQGVDSLKALLRQKLDNSGDFYAGAKVTVETRGAVVPPETVQEVLAILEDYGLSVSETEHEPAGRGRVRPEPSEPPAPAPVVSGIDPDLLPRRADTVMIRRTLRAGQSVTFDGNVLVMGDVNPGAEVSATGDIVVFGALRGVAHAGSLGNVNARVVALRLMPTQLRISDKITRAPDDEVQAPEGPEVALVREGSIIIEPWTSHSGMVFGA